MKKLVLVFMALCVAMSLVVAGCGTKKAASSQEAIDKSKTMTTTQEKSNYLVNQAKAFYNSKNFQEAINVAQYILRTVDKESKDAKAILDKARADLDAQMKKAAEDLRKSFSNMGKK